MITLNERKTSIFKKTYCDGNGDVYRRRFQVSDETKIELNCRINYFKSEVSKLKLSTGIISKEQPQSVKHFALYNAVRWN